MAGKELALIDEENMTGEDADNRAQVRVWLRLLACTSLIGAELRRLVGRPDRAQPAHVDQVQRPGSGSRVERRQRNDELTHELDGRVRLPERRRAGAWCRPRG